MVIVGVCFVKIKVLGFFLTFSKTKHVQKQQHVCGADIKRKQKT